MRLRIAIALLALAPGSAGAQEAGVMRELPREVEERVRAMQTDAAALHLSGPVTIAGDSVVGTDLTVAGGALHLDGRVAGDVLVVNGDLHLGADAAIDGDVLVIGGEIHGVETASVGGTLLAYGPVPDAGEGVVRRREGRRANERHRRDDDDDHWHRHRRDEGGLRAGLSIAGNYNRVEGLPIMFGPIIETAGPNRLHIAGQAIWRTRPSASLEHEIGYRVRVDQGLFADQLRLGGDVGSLVQPIERRGLNSTESSLAALLFHSDLHDYYEEQSWAARLEWVPAALPLHAMVTYRQAEHGVLEVSNPWSLFDDDDAWRAQPVIAEGDVSTLSMGITLDARDDEDEPVRGILAFLGFERTLDSDLRMPFIDLNGTVGGGLVFDEFTVASVDLRTHMPVNRFSTLNLRAVFAGAVEESALPPQFQRALGGVGTLPGFGLFEGACGSRDARVRLVTAVTAAGNELSDEAMHPAYGCDRVAIGQLEYRGGFDFDVRDRRREKNGDDDDESTGWDEFRHVDFDADWAFFADIARGWSFSDLTFADRSDTDTMVDVGIGLLLGQMGVYAALPITGDDRSLRVVARLQRRF